LALREACPCWLIAGARVLIAGRSIEKLEQAARVIAAWGKRKGLRRDPDLGRRRREDAERARHGSLLAPRARPKSAPSRWVRYTARRSSVDGSQMG